MRSQVGIAPCDFFTSDSWLVNIWWRHYYCGKSTDSMGRGLRVVCSW